jgi:hypothetical protein
MTRTEFIDRVVLNAMGDAHPKVISDIMLPRHKLCPIRIAAIFWERQRE